MSNIFDFVFPFHLGVKEVRLGRWHLSPFATHRNQEGESDKEKPRAGDGFVEEKEQNTNKKKEEKKYAAACLWPLSLWARYFLLQLLILFRVPFLGWYRDGERGDVRKFIEGAGL